MSRRQRSGYARVTSEMQRCRKISQHEMRAAVCAAEVSVSVIAPKIPYVTRDMAAMRCSAPRRRDFHALRAAPIPEEMVGVR